MLSKEEILLKDRLEKEVLRLHQEVETNLELEIEFSRLEQKAALLEQEKTHTLQAIHELSSKLESRRINQNDHSCQTDYVEFVDESEIVAHRFKFLPTTLQIQANKNDRRLKIYSSCFKEDSYRFMRILEESSKSGDLLKTNIPVQTKKKAQKVEIKTPSIEKVEFIEQPKSLFSHLSFFNSDFKQVYKDKAILPEPEKDIISISKGRLLSTPTDAEEEYNSIYTLIKSTKDEFPQEARNRMEVLINKGIYYPEKLRGYFWLRLIGNTLKITPLLYVSLKKRTDKMPESEPGVVKCVQDDIMRTYSDLYGSPTYEEILDECKSILLAFHLYRPDISYVQGMCYIAVFLRMHLNEYDSFVAFSNLVTRTGILQAFYLFDIPRMNGYLKIMSTIINRTSPEAHAKLDSGDINLSMLMIEWFFTLFSRQFDLIVVRVIWDTMFLKGEVFAIRLAIWIIIRGFETISHSDLDDTITLLKEYCLKQECSFPSKIPNSLLELQTYYNLISIYLPAKPTLKYFRIVLQLSTCKSDVEQSAASKVNFW